MEKKEAPKLNGVDNTSLRPMCHTGNFAAGRAAVKFSRLDVRDTKFGWYADFIFTPGNSEAELKIGAPMPEDGVMRKKMKIYGIFCQMLNVKELPDSFNPDGELAKMAGKTYDVNVAVCARDGRPIPSTEDDQFSILEIDAIYGPIGAVASPVMQAPASVPIIAPVTDSDLETAIILMLKKNKNVMKMNDILSAAKKHSIQAVKAFEAISRLVDAGKVTVDDFAGTVAVV
jgi:hypothetical protein